MARPIEIAFTSVRNHPFVRNLKALELGIFVRLVQANLIDGINPLPRAARELARLSGASIPQWNNNGPAALRAFDATIEYLTKWYQVTATSKQRRSAAALRVLGPAREKRRLTILAKQNAIEAAEVFLHDQSVAPAILQPTKAPRYRPEHTDYIERAKHSQQKTTANRLIDKG